MPLENKEQQEKKWLEFQSWIKQPSFQVYHDYLLKKKKAYEEDIKRMLRSADEKDLTKVRVAQALADNIDLVLTTHIDGIMKELKPPDQTDDIQIY
jgi:hypothetical protein